MLENAMAPLAWSNQSRIDNACECFALTYLASYNTNDLGTRTRESFRRAYAPDTLMVVPRVPGGRPAFSFAKWTGAALPRMTVAIEGMTSLSQLWVSQSGTAAAAMTPLPGYVYGAFKTYAETIYNTIKNDPVVFGAGFLPQTGIQFTGFSMGAAIAEIVATLFQKDFPTLNVRLWKFASPRVGNAAWTQSVERVVNTENTYVGRDRIDVIPYMTNTEIAFFDNPLNRFHTLYARNEPFERIDIQGRPINTDNGDGLRQYLEVIGDRNRTVESSNFWLWHNYDAYRLALCNQAVNHNSDSQDRFRYLEFDDDNGWQVNYRGGAVAWAGLKEMLGTNPPNFVNAVPKDVAEARVQALAQPIIPQDPMRQGQTAIPPGRRPVGTWIPRRTRDF